MSVQRLRRGPIVAMVVCGAAALASPRVQAQAVLPAEGGTITVVGCLVRSDKHEHGQSSRRFMLANPAIGSAETAPEANCSGVADNQAIDLKDTAKSHLGQPTLGRWVEVTGRLEPSHEGDARELHVTSFRMLPVAIPTPAAPAPPPEVRYMPAPQPQAAIPPLPAEQPVATSGTVPTPALPKTASSLPLFGLLSLLSLSGALSLHLVGGRRRE